jgi:hypothetical protein
MTRTGKGRMHWRATVLALCLLGGVVITVMVAQACALWSPVRPRFIAYRYRYLNERSWIGVPPPNNADNVPWDPNPGPRFERLEGAGDPTWMARYSETHALTHGGVTVHDELVKTWHGPGLDFELLALDEGLTEDAPVRPAARIVGVRSGWPLPCLSASCWQTSALWAAGPPVAGRWTSAVAAPDLARPAPQWTSSVPAARVLPCAPLWDGLVVNTAFYSACLLGLLAAAGIVVRMLRRAGGRCGACGYDRRGLAADARCPECGSTAVQRGERPALGKTAD